jgi:hypothetical protein
MGGQRFAAHRLALRAAARTEVGRLIGFSDKSFIHLT